jgi:hypothetical protein
MNGLLGRFPFHQIRPPPSSNVRKKRYAILVNNAGGIYVDRTLTADGSETTFGINHLRVNAPTV